MKKLQMRNWIYSEFAPSTLSIGADVIDQQIDNTVRYWNTHSAFKYTYMADYSQENFISVPVGMKNVVKVYPSVLEDSLLQNTPMGMLLGFVTLDSMTTDLIMTIQAMEGYRVYMGQDFRWRFERSELPDTVGGKLYVQSVPRATTKLAIVGLKRIVGDEEISDEFILDWVLKYALALCKVKEGNILRKAQIIGIQNDGQAMLDEGLKSVEELQLSLSQQAQWALLASRK